MKWKATVEELSESKVILSVDDDAMECGGCALASFCAPERSCRVELPLDGHRHVKVGAHVEVSAPDAVRWRAILYCLVLPVLFSGLAAAAVAIADGSELMVALAVVCAPVLYFLLFMAFYGRHAGESLWRIEEIID